MSSETNIIDEAAKDQAVAPARFDITSFGADYDVEGLVKRLNRDDIFIPLFQRNYVWNVTEASRFVESLLLGLPVPAVFLAREPDSNRLLVIDGQQRLKTLQFYFSGYFNPKEGDKTKRVFRLTGVQPEFEGRTYQELREPDRIQLNDSIIHAIIVKQESPPGDDTSVFHIFERLNSEGRKLTEQEMRAALYHGDFIAMLRTLNSYKNWRSIFGNPHSRLKDEELILRFLALEERADKYERPMAEFLTKFTAKNRKPSSEQLARWHDLFTKVIDEIHSNLGNKAFRPERALNAAVFDSVMVGVARRLVKGPIKSEIDFNSAYSHLLSDKAYQDVTLRATSDDTSVKKRIEMATQAFRGV